MKEIRKGKRITGKLFVAMLVMMLLFVNKGAVASADEFNYAQWYEYNGIYSVTGQIKAGVMSPHEACELIMRPAIQAGYVDSSEVDIFLESFPEMEAWFISAGVPPTDPAINVPAEPIATPTTPQYTIEDCDMYKYATTDVNVRVEPSTNTNKVGNVPQNEKVHVTGKTSNGWYRLEYNGTTGFSVSKYFADKPIEKVEDVTDVTEPTPAPTPEPTPVPTAEPTEEPTVEPTATPEPTEVPNDTKTEIVEPLETEKPVATPVPTVIPTEAPVVDEPTVEATAEPTVDSTPAPVVDTPVVTEPVEENNFIPWIALGGVVVVLGVVAVIVLKRKK